MSRLESPTKQITQGEGRLLTAKISLAIGLAKLSALGRIHAI